MQWKGPTHNDAPLGISPENEKAANMVTASAVMGVWTTRANSQMCSLVRIAYRGFFRIGKLRSDAICRNRKISLQRKSWKWEINASDTSTAKRKEKFRLPTFQKKLIFVSTGDESCAAIVREGSYFGKSKAQTTHLRKE